MKKLRQQDEHKVLRRKQLSSIADPSIPIASTKIPNEHASAPNNHNSLQVRGDEVSGVFDTIEDLVRSKGYETRRIQTGGIEVAGFRPIGVMGDRFIIDMVLLGFASGDRTVRSSDEQDISKEPRLYSISVSDQCRQLSETSRNIASAIHREGFKLSSRQDSISLSSVVPSLETCSTNLLLRKITYHRFKGKMARFWIRPILLTSMRLGDDPNQQNTWITAFGKSKENDVDIVYLGNLASYLDFRDKEVRILGAESLGTEAQRVCFPRALMQFRLLTILSALMMLGGFIAYAIHLNAGQSLAGISALLGIISESLGSWRLIRSYRHLDRENRMAYPDPLAITSDQIVEHESEFSPSELSQLYAKYGGAELSRLRKEFRYQRITELTRKAKEILGKIKKLEADEFYSEVVLSLDRSSRSLLTAVLLSTGVETQGKDLVEWIPLLRKMITNLQPEEVRTLWALRDRINKGHDATSNEVREAKRIVQPVIDDALDYLTRFLDGHTLSPGTTTVTEQEHSHQAEDSDLITMYQQRLNSNMSAAYSAHSNGDTQKFLYHLEQSLAMALYAKITELKGGPPATSTLSSLLRETSGLSLNLNQDEILNWLAKIEKDQIRTAQEVQEFEGIIIRSLETLGALRCPPHDDGYLVESESMEHEKPSMKKLGVPRISKTVKRPPETEQDEVLSPSVRLSNEILDVGESLKFILEISDEKELKDSGPAGIHLIEAKRALRGHAEEKSKSGRSRSPLQNRESPDLPPKNDIETRESPPTLQDCPRTVSEELDDIKETLNAPPATKNLNQHDADDERNTLGTQSNAPPNVLPFEHLGDFKKIMLYCSLPIVASFLSDDDSSREVFDSMKILVAKYHNQAAFIYVRSDAEEIAKECRIKSYPTILVFHQGRTIGELEPSNIEQLEKDLLGKLGMIGSTGSRSAIDSTGKKPSYGTNEDSDTELKINIDKLGVTGSP